MKAARGFSKGSDANAYYIWSIHHTHSQIQHWIGPGGENHHLIKSGRLDEFEKTHLGGHGRLGCSDSALLILVLPSSIIETL